MSPFEKLINYTSAHRLMTHVVFWLFIYIMLFNKSAFSGNPEELRSEMFETLYYEIFSIIGAYFFAYRILPSIMVAKNQTWGWIEFILGSYVLTVVARIIVIYVLEPLTSTTHCEQESITEILTDFQTLFRSYFMHTFSLSFFFVFLKLIKDQYLIQKKALLAQKEKAETELKILKAQLNPHFLFNTLNNIYSLSLINSPITSKSIAVLSEILDCILYRCSSTYVPISQEITLLNNYISLEKLRYDDRLSVIFNHAVDHNGFIAPLILLSLVENAFKHGAGEDTGSSPIIQIDLKLVDNSFEFTIRNTISKVDNQPESGKIGLDNIIRQLDKIYPENYTFKVIKTEADFTAYLQINLATADNLA